MGKNRLEAFSDGVLAIIITIMVLELKAPQSTEWAAIKKLLPDLVSYMMSFLFVGVYWANHHHLLHMVKKVSAGIMLANLNLLFWLSLVPFATGWVGETHFEPLPVAIYAALLILNAVSYTVLQETIAACHKHHPELAVIMKAQRRKGIISAILYALAIPLAFLEPYSSVVLFFLVTIMWLIPDKKIEKVMAGD
ncbi:MAG: DUF1211 domain-containing protein [Sphingobacteriales bacterium]|nr:DUF1211 domain-containing protein [Sphingobacteriales bacterium]